MANEPSFSKAALEADAPVDVSPVGTHEDQGRGGPPAGDQRSPLDGILEDPPADDHTLGDLDRALWDPNRKVVKGLE